MESAAKSDDDERLVALGEALVAQDPQLAARMFRRAADVGERAHAWARASAARQREVSAWGRAGRRSDALRATRAAVADVARLTDRGEAMAITSNLAVGLLDAGATTEALDLLDGVIGAAREARCGGDHQHDGLLAAALVNRASAMIDGRASGPPDALLDEAERLLVELGDQTRLATVLINRAVLASKRNELGAARTAYVAAAEQYRRAGADDVDVAYAIRGEAATLAAVGRLREALECYEDAAGRFARCGRADEALTTEIGAVMARHALGMEVAPAERDRLEGRLGDMPVGVAGSLAMNLANIATERGDLVAADRLRRRARRLFTAAGARTEVARVDLSAAVALRQDGQWDASLRRIAQARRSLVAESRWLTVAHADHNAALVLRERALAVEKPGGPLAGRSADFALQALSSLDRYRHSLPDAADRRALVARTYPAMFSSTLRSGLLALRPPEVAAVIERARVQPVLAGRAPIRLATPPPIAAREDSVPVGGEGRPLVLAREAARLAGRGAHWLGWWAEGVDLFTADSSAGRVHVALRDVDELGLARLAAALAVTRPADRVAANGDHDLAERIALWRATRGPLLADHKMAAWLAATLPKHGRETVAAEDAVAAVAAADDAQLLWPLSRMLFGTDMLERLMRPGAPRMRLVIAPPPALGRIPWAALPLRDPAAGGTGPTPRLVERADIVVGLPASLVRSPVRRRGGAAADDRVIVIADPTGDLPWTRAMDVPGALRLGAGARRATRAALSEALANGARMLVVAGHAEPGSDDDPASSALLLAGQDGQPDAFSVADIAAARVRAPAICMLLGCDGAGAATGNEWTGIATGWVWAGAAWVITTTWPVLDDAVTAALDADLVARVRRDGPLEGLWGWQRSLAERWARGRTDLAAAPYRWAGTIAVGSGARSAARRMRVRGAPFSDQAFRD